MHGLNSSTSVDACVLSNFPVNMTFLQPFIFSLCLGYFFSYFVFAMGSTKYLCRKITVLY